MKSDRTDIKLIGTREAGRIQHRTVSLVLHGTGGIGWIHRIECVGGQVGFHRTVPLSYMGQWDRMGIGWAHRI